MKKPKFRVRKISPKKIFVHLALAAAMALFNFALPKREPVAFALYYAALSAGFDPFLAGGEYLLSSLVSFSWGAALSCAVQVAFLTLVYALYRRFARRVGFERIIYAALCQLPFIFLFPHSGYAVFPVMPVLQKTVLAVFLLVLCMLFEGGLNALLFRAFRCRLSSGRIAEICLMCVFAGLGLLGALPVPVYGAIALWCMLFAVVLLKNASALLAAIVLSLPLAIATNSALPVAAFAILSSAALLFIPYGRITSSLAVTTLAVGAEALNGLYLKSPLEIALTLVSCILPAIVVISVPEKCYAKLNRSLLFYRERTLPRIAINRNRRAVGERLYEASALFREIETAFELDDSPVDGRNRLKEKLTGTLCKDCPRRARCEKAGVFYGMDKLIAVGKAKGRVNLIDLPQDVASNCTNSAGLMFALNKLLAQYRRTLADVEAAREGRRLLAEQAHGVSEILKDIALEQSEEFTFSGGERALSNAFAAAGLIATEIFLYGEGSNFTANVTLAETVETKKVLSIAGRALNVPLSLAEKIPLNAGMACYVLKRKANFDAAFGVASRPKDGQFASGDTHSVLKIDERRFLVALSDGMGSGDNAREVSDRTLSLFESFYKAKMPSDTVLTTVNRLISFSSEERFACLDLAAVNLDTGCADIVKIGSPAAYLLSGEELRVLEGESLPIGMLDAVHPATLRVTMKENDFLLFTSDGITSAYGSTSDFIAYLSALRPLNPQSLAEDILSDALKRYGGSAEDDMTVVAVKLMKTA